MEKGGEPLVPDDKPNFYKSVFDRTLTPKEVEDRYNHHFWVEDIDATLALVQKYIDAYGGWQILIPKTQTPFGFIAAVAVETGYGHTDTPDIIYIDQDLDRENE